MRRALIGLVLAATVLTPFAAQAQDSRPRNTDGGEEQSTLIEQRHQQRAERQAQQQAQEQRVEQQAPLPRQRFQPPPQEQQQFEQQMQRRQFQRQQFEQQQQQQQQQQAFGQRQGFDGNRGNWRGAQNNPGSIYPQAWQGDPNDPRLRRYQELERRNQQGDNNDRRNWRDNRSDWRNGGNDRGDWRNGGNDRRDWWGNRDGRNDWNRDWRNDNRYDWQRYRYSNRNRFRVGPYYSPYRNYGYNRFSIGVFLDSLFFNQRYWIGDPWQYRLPAAYPGTQWIRYYNDVLLVDVYTGEVVDVIYDFFW